MAPARRVLVALAIAGVCAAPLHADVIPTRHASDSDAPRKVEARLQELGLSGADAHRQAARLSDEEASFFAADLGRVQAAGQEMMAGQSDNFWEEWVFGIVALGAAVGFYAVYAYD